MSRRQKGCQVVGERWIWQQKQSGCWFVNYFVVTFCINRSAFWNGSKIFGVKKNRKILGLLSVLHNQLLCEAS